MQEEVTSGLKLTVAKLELKQLEFIDKLSQTDNDYIIRCITDPETAEIIAINGDWENVAGWGENECVGKCIYEFIPEYELDRPEIKSTRYNTTNKFDSFMCDLKTKACKIIEVDWKAKYYPEINATVSIGRVKK